MRGLDGHDPVQRARDVVYAEELERVAAGLVADFRLDDAAVLNGAVTRPGERVLHFQLVYAVAFLRDLRLRGVGHEAQTVGDELRRVFCE